VNDTRRASRRRCALLSRVRSMWLTAHYRRWEAFYRR
jgi:hypothetical protein